MICFSPSQVRRREPNQVRRREPSARSRVAEDVEVRRRSLPQTPTHTRPVPGQVTAIRRPNTPPHSPSPRKPVTPRAGQLAAPRYQKMCSSNTLLHISPQVISKRWCACLPISLSSLLYHISIISISFWFTCCVFFLLFFKENSNASWSEPSEIQWWRELERRLLLATPSRNVPGHFLR